MQSTQKTKPRVLIIGCGLGGAALAQTLRAKNIPFDLFERDASDAARAQGWAISLHQWFIKDLLASTKDDLPDLETVSNTFNFGLPGQGAIFEASNMNVMMRFGSGQTHDMIRANRSKLRAWLLTDVPVHWGKRFTHYEQDDTGVTAFFEDGSSCRGDMLVGADGVNSRVRSQLLPDSTMKPERLPLGVVIGELTASKEQYERWLHVQSSDKSTATAIYIGWKDNLRLTVALRSVAPDLQSARYYWMYIWMDPKAKEKPFWTETASQQQMHDFVMSRLDGLHTDFTEPMRATPVEGIVHPPIVFQDMLPPELPRGRVTLLGDSTHAMVPFRGQGGNMAMEDGLSLAKVIETENAKSVEDMLKEYEAEMIPMATKAVLESRAATDPSMAT